VAKNWDFTQFVPSFYLFFLSVYLLNKLLDIANVCETMCSMLTISRSFLMLQTANLPMYKINNVEWL
tara:strand:- start:526 stop:726 length:201 start_codon:yes stop_codon:yes gene_type:complete